MKLLIVDDERHVREAIRLLADWSALGITDIREADNGQEAIALIERERPEILITDMMMPVRSGLDLLEWLQERQLPIQKIVISGHNDFHLVRGTMQYGGQDYLLKPIDPEQLTEALRKAISLWEKGNEVRKQDMKRNMEINQLRPVLLDKVFSDLLNGSRQYTNALTVLRDDFGLPNLEKCQVAILSLYAASAGEVMAKYSHNRDLLFFTLTNICNEIARRGNRGLACRNMNGPAEILIFYWGDAAGAPGSSAEPIVRMLEEINEGCYLTLRSRFDFGIGSWEPFPKGATLSYRAAQAALRDRDLLAKKIWFHTRESGSSSNSKPVPFIQLTDAEESFRLAALSGSFRQIEDAVSRWMTSVEALPAISCGQLEQWREEFSAMQARWHKNLSSEGTSKVTRETSVTQEESPLLEPAPLLTPFDEEGLLSLKGLAQELQARISSWAQEKSSQAQQGQSAIPDIAKYIEQHYNEELTLADIASHFYLSREYISRKFKQEMGENLIDYLGRIRIEKAKLLLHNPAFRIAQVAEMVGYADEKYFSKVFKKIAGQSPNQYRKSGLD